MKKAILTLAVLCGIGLMAGCKGGTADESATDTVAEKINQYNADGKKDGLWRYNEGDVMITEVRYDNGNECGELKMFLDGKLFCHISDIERVDTTIGENTFEYKAHYKDFEDGSIITKEGNGYYNGYEGLIPDGFLGVGDWRVYDTLSGTYKTVNLTEPTFDESIRIK